MAHYENISILIPAYNPDQKLTDLVNEMIMENFKHIIIVNDGSDSECNDIFHSLSKLEECVVLKHDVNQGKGRALKTAFAYLLNKHNGTLGLVTVDADGQHAVDDIKKVVNKLSSCPDSMVLGVRDFSSKNIPFRSRFGNVLTKSVYRFASGLKISDTQTGLRGIPYRFLKSLLHVKGERYEYEMNMLLECKANRIEIEEVKIQTIYIDKNESSHFNPIIDSIKIYSVFFKFISSSLLSFGADILLFAILTFLLKGAFPYSFIIVATIGSRVLSSLFNYIVNRKIVFKTSSRNTLLKYYILSACQMLISATAVYFLYLLIGNGEVWIKIGVDFVLFLFSFVIQREWVFKNSKQLDGVR